MQTIPTLASGKTALWYGVIAGISLGIIQIICISFLSGIGFLLSLPISIVVLLFAGMFAAKRTGKVVTGMLAGLWGGLFSSVVVLGLFVLLLSTVSHAELINEIMKGAVSGTGSSITPEQAVRYAIAGSVILCLFWLLVAIGAGAGIGAIGGLIGKTKSSVVQQPLSPEIWPYQQYEAQPQYGSAPQYGTSPSNVAAKSLPYPLYGSPPPNVAAEPLPYPITLPPSQSQQPSNSYSPPVDQSSSTVVNNPYSDPEIPPSP